MPRQILFAALAAAVLGALSIGASSAEARCTTLAFSVNDYGKDGPTKDAKELLDKYIAKWTKDNNVTNYTVGKKDVSCELFLNFIVFDEHTCKATALVCWNGSTSRCSGCRSDSEPRVQATGCQARGQEDRGLARFLLRSNTEQIAACRRGRDNRCAH